MLCDVGCNDGDHEIIGDKVQSKPVTQGLVYIYYAADPVILQLRMSKNVHIFGSHFPQGFYAFQLYKMQWKFLQLTLNTLLKFQK